MEDDYIYEEGEPLPWNTVPDEKLVDEEAIELLKYLGYSERLRYGNELAARFKRSNDPKIIEQLERFYQEEMIAEALDFPSEIMTREKIWANLFLDARRKILKKMVEEDSPLIMRADLLKIVDAQTALVIFKRHYDEFDGDQRLALARRLINSKDTCQAGLEFLRPKFDSLDEFSTFVDRIIYDENKSHWAHYIINSSERFSLNAIEKYFSTASEEDKFLALKKYYDEFDPPKRLKYVLECGQSSVTLDLFDFLVDRKFFDALTEPQLQTVAVHFNQTSAKGKMLDLLRSKFDSPHLIEFMNKCLNNADVSEELRASIIFNAPEDFSLDLIMKFWSKAEQADRIKIFKRRGNELIESHLQFLLETMAKGELPSNAIDALEKRFGAKELAEKVLKTVDKEFFSSKMISYILDLKKQLPLDMIVDLLSHAQFRDKYRVFERYAETMPRDKLIALANELVRDDIRISFFADIDTQAALIVGEILRSKFDEKEFIEIVTECAAWSIEHDADKVCSVLSRMPLFEMHFTTTPIERRISPPRKWANFIFNAPEKFPTEIIVKLFPYAWMHDQMTAMEKYFYDLTIDQRQALGWALVNEKLDREELPSFTTTMMNEIMELNWQFEQRQARLKELLQSEDEEPIEPSKSEAQPEELIECTSLPEKLSALERDFDELDSEQQIDLVNTLIQTQFADRVMQILRSKMSVDELADFIWACKERGYDIKKYWAQIVLDSPNEFPEVLIQSLKPYAPPPTLEFLEDGDLLDVVNFLDKINKEYKKLKARDSEPED